VREAISSVDKLNLKVKIKRLTPTWESVFYILKMNVSNKVMIK